MATLGELMESAREERGWTKAEAARRLGVTRQYYGDLVRGERDPDLQVIATINQVLGLDLRWSRAEWPEESPDRGSE